MPDIFTKEKQGFLSKKDKSKKGSIDKEIVPLITLINRHPNYYTTSSCSGRIVLLLRPTSKKNEASWLLVSHAAVKARIIMQILAQNQGKTIWLKQEALIMHVRCRNVSAAVKFLDTVRPLYKRAGIGHPSLASFNTL